MKKYMRDDITELFVRADNERFAIPGFNYSDLWDLKALVAAAEAENAPVFLMADPPVYDDIGRKMCCAMADTAAEEAKVPIIHHLDHCSDIQICKEAVSFGFPSVMMDASDQPIAGNISKVCEITSFAHKSNCFVEAEIGRIRGESAYETSYTGDHYLFLLDDAIALVEQAQPDSLAIGIGNAHGFYTGKPEINFEKLKEAYAALRKPLILHGGTGIPFSDIKRVIQLGIRKVNIGTDIYTTYMNAVRSQLIKDGENQFTLEVMESALIPVIEVARKWIQACGASGKAK